jgi:hypothetical protein
VLLSVPCRVSYLPLLNDLLQSANPLNWRLRQSLAGQLSRLMDLLPAQNLFGTLFPLTMALVQDPVSQVRLASYPGVARMIVVLLAEPENPILPPPSESAPPAEVPPLEEGEVAPIPGAGGKYLSAVARSINALIFSESYTHRQVWAELARTLLREIPQHLFETYFVDGLVRLSADPVPNVRVAVAEALTGWEPNDYAPWETVDSAQPPNAESQPTLIRSPSFKKEEPPRIVKRTDRPCPWKLLLAREDIIDCVRRMEEEDPDVYLNMRKLQPMFPHLEFRKRSCRGLHAAPGGPAPVPSHTIPVAKAIEDKTAVPTVDIATTPHFRRTSQGSFDGELPEEGSMQAEGLNEPAPWFEQPKKLVMTKGEMSDMFPSKHVESSDADRRKYIIEGAGAFEDEEACSPPRESYIAAAAAATAVATTDQAPAEPTVVSTAPDADEANLPTDLAASLSLEPSSESNIVESSAAAEVVDEQAIAPVSIPSLEIEQLVVEQSIAVEAVEEQVIVAAGIASTENEQALDEASVPSVSNAGPFSEVVDIPSNPERARESVPEISKDTSSSSQEDITVSAEDAY